MFYHSAIKLGQWPFQLTPHSVRVLKDVRNGSHILMKCLFSYSGAYRQRNYNANISRFTFIQLKAQHFCFYVSTSSHLFLTFPCQTVRNILFQNYLFQNLMNPHLTDPKLHFYIIFRSFSCRHLFLCTLPVFSVPLA